MITAGAVALALLLVLVPASSADLPLPWALTGGGNTVVQGRTPLQLTPADWQEIALPVPSSRIASFAADPTHPGRIILCASSAASTTVWMTENSGQSWITQATLPGPAARCSVNILGKNPSTVVLQVDSADTPPVCSHSAFYLSTDLGVSWHQLPHTTIAPAAGAGWCTAWGSPQHMFIETNYTVGTAATSSQHQWL